MCEVSLPQRLGLKLPCQFGHRCVHYLSMYVKQKLLAVQPKCLLLRHKHRCLQLVLLGGLDHNGQANWGKLHTEASL